MADLDPCAPRHFAVTSLVNRDHRCHRDLPLSQATGDAARADVLATFLAVDKQLYLNRVFSCRVHLKIYNEQTNSIYKKTETMIRMFLTETGVKNVVL